MNRQSPSIALRLAIFAALAWSSAVHATEPASQDHHGMHATASSDLGKTLAEVPQHTSDLIGMRALTVDGTLVHLGLDHGARPITLVFVDDGCTISRRYVPRLNALGRWAEDNGVDLYAVLSNPAVSPAEARTFRDEYQLEPPLLFDANGSIARQLKPATVPSAFVVQPSGHITYRGRIDDRFPSLTKIRPQASVHDLLQAMEAATAGPIARQVHTPAIGCAFSSWPDQPEAPNYAEHVAPILSANCTECHRSGGVAPFSLEGYDAARRWSTMISAMTRLGLMPPWRAERGFGHFREERFLTDRQIALLAAWDRADAPQGDPEHLLPLPQFADSEWPDGEPDLVLTMPTAFEVPADGEDIYRYFVLPMDLAEDVVVVGMDFQPGDPTVVHHCNYFVDYSGRGRELDLKDPAPGFSVFDTGGFMSYDGPNALAAWAPGVAPYRMPEGRGFDLPRGGDIILEVHYHLTGKATTDRSSIGFYLAKGPVERGVSALFVGTQDVDIPAGEANYWRKLSMDIPADVQLVDIAPHMHYLGREVRATATLPDGNEVPLLHVTDWDLRWQGIYSYREPITLPAGSVLEAAFRFDNSSSNPANPHTPPRRVAWGWGSDEEMAELYLTTIPKDAEAETLLQRSARASWTRSADPEAPDVENRSPEDWVTQLMPLDLWSAEGESLLTAVSGTRAFAEVVALARQRAKATRKDPRAHALAGTLLSIASSWGETPRQQWDLATAADAALKKAIRLDPDHSSARLTLGALYGESQDPTYMRQAISIYRSLIKREDRVDAPHHIARAYLALGRVHEALGDRDRALATWRQGTAKHPDHAGLREQLLQADPAMATGSTTNGQP